MPGLVRVSVSGVSVWTDTGLRASHGVLVAFTERGGGVSRQPFTALDLAAHVGDDPAAVDVNRDRLFAAIGLGPLRPSLVSAEQVHGDRVARVTGADTGSGAYAEGGAPPIAGTDALLTTETGVPLMMLFADCVPVVLVATGPTPAVGVAHCGRAGALAGLAGETAVATARAAGCATSDLLAYLGPHVGPCHYELPAEMLSPFAERFATLCQARDRLDLGAVVSESLNEVGVLAANTVSTGICTAESTAAFYSYRAEGTTGRHGALAAILGQER